MTKGFRIAFVTAAVAAGVAFAGASPAQAQVGFSGSFPLPHGRISIGIGAPEFAIGTYVPNGYDVYAGDDGGYGFEYENRWVPVRQYSDRWVICEPSQAYGYGVYGYGGGHSNYGYSGGYDQYYERPSYGYRRDFGFRHGYRQNFGFRHGYRQDFRDRDHGRFERREWDGRRGTRSHDGNRDGYRH
ncbi:MAG: hypothetical protein ABJC07_06035 [Acidobacteriota bacterium]